MGKLFSQRKAKPQERYRYDLPDQVRSRILHTLAQLNSGYNGGSQYDFQTVIEEIGRELLARLGGLRGGLRSNHLGQDTVRHFQACSDDEALDFIELFFQVNSMWGAPGEAYLAVDRLNNIFEEEGLGYELTQLQQVETDRTGLLRTEYPQVIRKDEKTTHEVAVKPALEVLRDPRFATANSELLDAFEEICKGKYPHAITSCGSAFESVLKTICDIKKWAYDPKDTCAPLVEACRVNNLFWPFYTEQLKGVGINRNNLGDAHGKGPAPKYKATREHAEHMIALTCSHITFVIRQAKI